MHYYIFVGFKLDLVWGLATVYSMFPENYIDLGGKWMVMALVTILYWISDISINNEGSLVMGYIFKNGLYDILYEVN
jgi:hypothetical protein